MKAKDFGKADKRKSRNFLAWLESHGVSGKEWTKEQPMSDAKIEEALIEGKEPPAVAESFGSKRKFKPLG